jgi:hypothetical protein
MAGREIFADPSEGALLRVVGDTIRVLAGGSDTGVGDSKWIAAPGCFVNVPAGTFHTYRILSEGAKFVIITSPAGASDFFTELDREAGGSVEDLDKIVQIALRHGFSVPPPPVAQ